MPTLNLSDLNVIISVLGAYTCLYGVVSVKIKEVWYLGEALPAMIFGIILGPLSAKFIDSERWGSATAGQTPDITLGITRVVIGIQLVIVGYQLPAKYSWTRCKELALCLLPIMGIMWICTTACIMVTVPKVTFLAALVIGSCVTSTDPVLSQAIAKGPFADKYVARPLREIVSAEAGANDGFVFPFLMLATYLIRHAKNPDPHRTGLLSDHSLITRSQDVGRLGGGAGEAMKDWFIETWLYMILMSMAYGAVVGFAACKGIHFALKRKWIDSESYVLLPAALGLFTLGTCGLLGTDDLLACFVAGCVLNWDGEYLKETDIRHDEVNSCIDVILNFGGFMYIGAVLPWSDFNDPDGTGITWGRLMGLGFLVLVLRRLPAILALYKLMPGVCAGWKEAFFMGYFGPIGIGAVFYVEHTRHLFPQISEAEGDDETVNLLRAIGPSVYWLVFFSIVIHGLSIPALSFYYKFLGARLIKDDAVQVRRASIRAATPINAVELDPNTFVAYNRFSRPGVNMIDLPVVEGMLNTRPSFQASVEQREQRADLSSSSNDEKYMPNRE